MAKIVLIFLALCISSIISAEDVYSPPAEDVPQVYSPPAIDSTLDFTLNDIFPTTTTGKFPAPEDDNQVTTLPSVNIPQDYTSLDTLPTAGEVPVIEADYTELYTVFATSIFDFVAKFIRAKVDLVLWMKKVLINVAVPWIIHLKNWYIAHQHQVDGTARALVEVIQVFGGVFNNNDHVVPHSVY